MNQLAVMCRTESSFFILEDQGHARMILSIILLFGQQTEPSRSLLRPGNSHINRRKIEK